VTWPTPNTDGRTESIFHFVDFTFLYVVKYLYINFIRQKSHRNGLQLRDHSCQTGLKPILKSPLSARTRHQAAPIDGVVKK